MTPSRLSRRDFMKNGAAAAGAYAVAQTIALEPEGPAWTRSAARPVAPSDRVRFGIVGVGMQGSGLLANSIQLPGVDCAMACDLYDARHTLAQEITARPDLPTTRRYQELLDNKEIDCVIVAVPDHWHKQVVVDAVSAGKDVYCEKPMSHSPADGVAMVQATEKSGRIVQVGSQRVSGIIAAKAKELLAQGIIGDLTLIQAWNGRNSPCGAWEYPLPPGISTENLDWDTWQGTAPHRPFDAKYFARWRCWREYGTGVAGDLMVHLVSGMLAMLGTNDPPARCVALGGILRWKDGRDMPDVHASMFRYDRLGEVPVYLQLNLGTEFPEGYQFMGSKGILEVNGTSITCMPQSGEDDSPCYYAASFPRAMHDAYVKEWSAEHDTLGKEQVVEGVRFTGPSWDDTRPHLWNFFQAVKSRQPVVEDVVFGHHAALACHMANESYFLGHGVRWDAASQTIEA
jgi:predicted dehydrogenase